MPETEDPLGNLGMFLIPSLILGTAASCQTMPITRTMMEDVRRITLNRPQKCHALCNPLKAELFALLESNDQKEEIASLFVYRLFPC